MLDALRAARVDAVWVGWGFLAEHASFAQRCEEAGIVFVGPDSATIRLLGDKVAAKRVAEQAGVPVVPWSGRPVTDAADAAAHAQRLGYPVMLKAAAGGGGRGIRLVREPAELAAALDSARARGDAGLRRPDRLPGAASCRPPGTSRCRSSPTTTARPGRWACGTARIQRRHQKVIEESASTALDAAAEQAIKAAAVRLAAAAGYRNAGTVEFLVDPGTGAVPVHGGQHPAAGRAPGDRGDHRAGPGEAPAARRLRRPAGPGRRRRSRGHAVEARLCAEDPENGLRAGTGSDRAAATAGRPGHPGGRRDARGRRRCRRTSTR